MADKENRHIRRLKARLHQMQDDLEVANRRYLAIFNVYLDTRTALIQALLAGEGKKLGNRGDHGGKKSKRVLTPEQAKAMVEAREKKKRDKG